LQLSAGQSSDDGVLPLILKNDMEDKIILLSFNPLTVRTEALVLLQSCQTVEKSQYTVLSAIDSSGNGRLQDEF